MPLSYPSGWGCLFSSPTHPWLRAAPGTAAAQDFILPCELATGPQRPEEAEATRTCSWKGVYCGLENHEGWRDLDGTPQPLP